jgi:hypothetical protein
MLAGVTACGRDRAETGSSRGDQAGAATLADTGVAAAQSALIDRDTSSTDTTSGAAPGARQQPVTNNDRKTAQPKTLNVAPDTSVSGYQAMGRDRAAPAGGTASAPDTASTEMADAVVTPAAADTGRRAADTVIVGDSAEIGKTGERIEPTQSSEQANADTLTTQTESDRVRPPEDSTETLGNVTTGDSMSAAGDTAVTGSAEMARDTSTALAQADTMAEVQVDTTTQVTHNSTQVGADTGAAIQAQVDTTTTLAQDTERVRPPEDSVEAAAAGVRTSGNVVTGGAAVATLTREGRPCAVVQTEESEQDIRWDMASSPATMNPCGTGTMTLSRIQTKE